MNLIIPINVQALSVTPSDVSNQRHSTKNPKYFAGQQTHFANLPWINTMGTSIPSASALNLSSEIIVSLAEAPIGQLQAGIHLHWQLPDALTKGQQTKDGRLEFPNVPNRWLITRFLDDNGTVTTKQWVVESDQLMTEEEYQQYTSESFQNSNAIPVGWQQALNRVQYQDAPYRYLGRIYEIEQWPDPDQQSYMPTFTFTSDNLVASGLYNATSLGKLKAVGNSGPTFAAYYPDCVGVFGFRDSFYDQDNGQETFLEAKSFGVSYQVVGWHDAIEDDPLQILLTKPTDVSHSDWQAQISQPQTVAELVKAAYNWAYTAKGVPERCVYSGAVLNLQWNNKSNEPLAIQETTDNTVRVGIGNSTASAFATLLAHTIEEASTEAQAVDNETQSPKRPVEFFLDALQFGLLNQLGSEKSISAIENALQQASFEAVDGGLLWVIRKKESSDEEVIDPGDFTDELGDLLDELNIQQRSLDSVLDVIKSLQQTIFVDWYQMYRNSVADRKLANDVGSMVENEILDLWAKMEAAFGIKRVASARLRDALVKNFGIAAEEFTVGTNNYPQFYSGAITLEQDAKTFKADALAGTLSAKVAELASKVSSQLGDAYELHQSAAPRFWAPNDLVIAITSEQVKPAQRNGLVRFLPVRQSDDMLTKAELTLNGNTNTFDGGHLTSAINWASLSDLPAKIHADVMGLLVENCLLNASALLEISKQQRISLTRTDFQTLTKDCLEASIAAWNERVRGLHEVIPEMPDVIVDPHSQANGSSIAWTGTMPQGLALTYQSGETWENPFLPLFMMWKAQLNRFEYGSTGYPSDFIKSHFQLEDDLFDYTLSKDPPNTLLMSQDFSTLTNDIIISSRTPLTMVDQIIKYLSFADDHKKEFSEIVDNIRHLPTLSGGLSGINLSLLTRQAGLQMVPFNPFFNQEKRPTKLGSSYLASGTDYQNFLTWFVANSVPINQVEQVPNGQQNLYEPLRTGYFTLTEIAVVDVFGRKRVLLTDGDPTYNQKVFPSWRLAHDKKIDHTGTAQITRYYLPPRIAQASRLLMRWLSADNGTVESNTHPISSPICGWVIANYFDNSLMLFDKDGKPFGSVGAYGAQPFATWQSVPGAPAQSILQDLANANEEVRRFAFFFYRKPRERFQSMLNAIANAQSQMLPHDLSASAQSQAILMSQPLALARVSLRLELQGLPAFNTSNRALQADLEAHHGVSSYDWTQRNYDKLLEIDFPVQIGDNDDFDDGLVAYFTAEDTTTAEDKGRYYPQQIYAPAADAQPDSTEVVRQPKPDTIQLNLRPRIDIPTSPGITFTNQIEDIKSSPQAENATVLTLLIDPRSKVHALTGILPVKDITIPSEQYITALGNLEVTFFTHPILRPVPGLQMPIPPEPGFTWQWITALKYKDTYDFDNPIKFKAVEQSLSPQKLGDRAFFTFSPQVIEDGWLSLKRTEEDGDQSNQSN